MLSYFIAKIKTQLPESELRILLNVYRCISLFFTSILYIAGPPNSTLYLKLGVCACLVLEACLFIKVYDGEKSKDRNKKFLLFLETIGLTFILYVTGGMSSPFLWYALNPILLSAALMPFYFCWLLLGTFTFLVYLADIFTIFRVAETQPHLPASTLVIIFALITLIAQLYNFFFRNLARQSALLEKQLLHIKSLYGAVEAFSHYTDPQEVVNLFASYVKVLANVNKAIIWVEVPLGLQSSEKKLHYAVRGPRDVLSEDVWYPHIKQLYLTMQVETGTEARTILIQTEDEEGMLITVPIRSKAQYFGIFSVFLRDDQRTQAEIEQTMRFLAELCAAALDNYALESIAQEYLLVEEKDRIAGEIHDHVTQNLFALIYSLDLLIHSEPLAESVQRQLKLLQKTAQHSLRDLRTSIYSMSSKKHRQEPLIEDIRDYLADFSELNKVKIDFNTEEIHLPLPSSYRNNLYRIIREATGNAIRHGHCSHLQVTLASDHNGVTLSINDNGYGFDTASVHSENGLGLINMKELTRNMGGELTITSIPGVKTVVQCILPEGTTRRELLAR
ncbi:MAG: sensor histidine kinase [Firmicutes bacterium]|nr:sensor histidine kinase [Bacillota bacterium]